MARLVPFSSRAIFLLQLVRDQPGLTLFTAILGYQLLGLQGLILGPLAHYCLLVTLQSVCSEAQLLLLVVHRKCSLIVCIPITPASPGQRKPTTKGSTERSTTEATGSGQESRR